MNKQECRDFAEIPDGLGYDADEKECQGCIDAEECKTKTEERIAGYNKPKPKKSNHRFIAGTARGDVAEWLKAGVPDADIVKSLVEGRKITEKNAKRKVWAVKKILKNMEEASGKD